MQNISDLQQKLNEAEAHVNELRKQMDAQRKNERTQAITTVKELIKSHDLTAADLGFSGKTATKRASTGDKRNSVAPKYQDPDSGKISTCILIKFAQN